jgi:hypothetical protein
MAARVHRAERILDQFAERHGITADGLAWFKLTTDPFHDTLKRAVGYPDNNVSVSVPRIVPYTLPVSAPPYAVTNNTTWNAHIFNCPFLNSVPTQAPNAVSFNNINETTASPMVTLGGITALCTTSTLMGTATEWSATNFTSGPLGAGISSMSSVVPDPAIYAGKSRTTGSALEIYNTTAEIYKQGTVTVYRTPTPDYTTNSSFYRFSNAGNSVNNSFQTAVVVPSWPISTSLATTLRGSRTWDAKEGVYQVHALHSDELPCDGSNYIQPYFSDSSLPAGLLTPTYSTTTAVFTGGSPPLSGLYVGGAQPMSWTKFDMSGSIFTGLSPQTTLYVRWNVMFENFPPPSNTMLTTLANPSPCYDPKAIELYSYAMSDMPVGVKVNENGLGDWFSGVVSKISNAITPIMSNVTELASKIPHPKAKLLSAVMSASSSSKPSNSHPTGQGQLSAPNSFVRAGKSVLQAVRGESGKEKSKNQTKKK